MLIYAEIRIDKNDVDYTFDVSIYPRIIFLVLFCRCNYCVGEFPEIARSGLASRDFRESGCPDRLAISSQLYYCCVHTLDVWKICTYKRYLNTIYKRHRPAPMYIKRLREALRFNDRTILRSFAHTGIAHDIAVLCVVFTDTLSYRI